MNLEETKATRDKFKVSSNIDITSYMHYMTHYITRDGFIKQVCNSNQFPHVFGCYDGDYDK